jgi:hypothetical protein
MFVLWKKIHFLSSSAMSITILRVFIGCKDNLNPYHKESLILYYKFIKFYSFNDICNEHNVDNLFI